MRMSLTDKIMHSMHKMAEPVKRLLLRKSAMPHEKVTPKQALEWCQNFLRGAWSTIDVEQMCMERVHGGLSNYLYCCSLPDQVELQGNEPRKVLLRIYGEAHQKHRGTLLIDSIVCTLLSERKLGPHVHGIFSQGRIEEFIEADSLLVSEIREENTSRTIAQLLGELHQLDMPLVKEPLWLFRTIDQYLVDLPNDVSKFEIEDDRHIFEELKSVCNFTNEAGELEKLLATVNSPVCFTHNDFQPGNILRVKSQADKLTVIDFEYCLYNYRGFDIGNHFCEFMFDYKSATEWPFFRVDFTLYPNENQQLNFITSYIDAMIAAQEQSLYSSSAIEESMDNENNPKSNATIAYSKSATFISLADINRDELARQIMKEANYFAMASHFFWALWAINMATSTAIKFGYMEYARTRLTAYYLTRDMIIGTDGLEAQMPPQFNENLLRSANNPFHKSYVKLHDKPSSD